MVETLCCFIFIVVLVIGVKSFAKKVPMTPSEEDIKRRQAERVAERLAKRRSANQQERDLSPEPPTLAEIKAKLEEEKHKPREKPGMNVLNPEKQKTKKPIEPEQMQEEAKIEEVLEVNLVSPEKVVEISESDPGVSLVETAPSPAELEPMPPEDPEEQGGGVVDIEAIEQSGPEDGPTDDGSIRVEFFCETCMGEGVVTYDTEQIFKDKFEGQSVAWNGLLKSIDRLSYDRHFQAENGFLATLEIYVIKGRYDSRPVLAVVLLTPEQKATWESSLNQEMAFSGMLIALDAFGKKVYLKLRG